MKVREFIEELSQHDPEADVTLALDEFDVIRGEGWYLPWIMPDTTWNTVDEDGGGVALIHLGERRNKGVKAKDILEEEAARDAAYAEALDLDEDEQD